jgi:RNA polymerase sigma-70 factor (ECF subfamily)
MPHLPSSLSVARERTAPSRRAHVPAARPPLVARDDDELRAGLVALLPELRARALRLSGNPALADDVAQDALERALRFASQYEPGTNLRAWAMQIVFTVFITRWRRRRRERVALEQLAADPHAWTFPAAHPAPDAGERALLPSTVRKLDALPPGFRAVIVLVDLERRTYRDAARELGVPVGTVMSRLHRGRKLLAAQIGEAREAA